MFQVIARGTKTIHAMRSTIRLSRENVCLRSEEKILKEISRNASVIRIQYAYRRFRNFSEIAHNCETISQVRALLSRISLRVAGIFADVGQIRSDWNVKEPVPRLQTHDTAALKCIHSQKKSS